MATKIDKLQEKMSDILAKALEAGRDKAIDVVRKRVKSGNDEKGSPFGSYGKSQRGRREKEGLQTGYKDLHYSGTLFENFVEVNRNITEYRGELDISFTGAPYRRPDQKAFHMREPKTNIELASLLNIQNKNKTIIGLSDSEKTAIKDAMIKAVGDELQNITIT